MINLIKTWLKHDEKPPEFVRSTDPAVESLKRATGTDIHHAVETEVARTLRVVAGWDLWGFQTKGEIRKQIRMLADDRDPEITRPREGQARQSYIKRSPLGKETDDG